MSDLVLTEHHDGGVALLRLNRPPMNPLSIALLDALRDAATELAGDGSVKAVVVAGSEKAFAAGADIKEMVEKPGAQFFAEDFFAGWQNEFTKPTRKPWIAAVNGFALGGGCEVAMMADFIIASETAKFGQPEIKLAVAPGMGGTQRLTRAVGKAKAMDLMLTGRNMDAAEAERSGLVSRVVPAAELMNEALKAAEAIAAMPPLAAMMNKEMCNIAFETPLETGLLVERRMFQILTATEDKTEGMTAFVEKRPGVWKGK
jgi:enoyl-CoA hydratase